MIRKIKLLVNTIKYLKSTQVFYQLKYRLKKPGTLNDYNKTYVMDNICFLTFKKTPPVYNSYSQQEFQFLNQKVKFDSEIDWNYQGNGKLWNYNLQYANYLLQDGVESKGKEHLMKSMYSWLNDGKLPLEPYPASLRSINMMRWLSSLESNNDSLMSNVHAELDFLSKRLEYHLLGNHLLENAFALMMGGAFFSNEAWLKQGQGILKAELEEQILADGAHFELSPMYHQVIFFRLLELIDWYSSWTLKETAFEQYLRNKASLMLSWLKNISFKNGDIPHFNDSAEGIAYSTEWLSDYAEALEVESAYQELSESGYRSVEMQDYECKIDFAQLGPSYQPGHAHADALSFILYHNNEPLFVEAGTSTYQNGKRRTDERSTFSHNTVVFNDENQSQVYGGFRVGKRAITTLLIDKDFQLKASHNGYYHFSKIIHEREFLFDKETITINDSMINADNELFYAYFHLAPQFDNVDILSNYKVDLSDKISIKFDGSIDLEINEYNFATGFNQSLKAKVLKVSFRKQLKSTILLNNV